MGVAVLVLGASGTGKSASLRNFDPKEIGIFNVASKPLPFKGKMEYILNEPTYGQIMKSLEDNKLKCYVIDDSQYLMAFEEFDKVKVSGYGKFTEMALNFYNLLQCAIKRTSPDTVVYFLHHTERDDEGHIKAKTVGKMIDSKLTLEGLFSLVLLTGTDGNEYWFETQTDGYSTAKSPIGLFPDKRIPNDLKAVDTAIREYWNLGESKKGGK